MGEIIGLLFKWFEKIIIKKSKTKLTNKSAIE